MVFLASKVHPIPLKFLSKDGQNSTLRAAILNCPWRQILPRDQRSANVGSFFRAHVTRPLINKHKIMDTEVIFENVFSKTLSLYLNAIRVTLPASWVRPHEWNRLRMAKYSRLHLSQTWAPFLIFFFYRTGARFSKVPATFRARSYV